MTRVVKIGGGIIDSEQQLDAVLDSIARSTDPVILVHGGGRLATDLATRIGIDQTMIDGRRVTDIDTLRIVTMTYAGWINKSIVAKLQARDVNAIGLCGADNDIIRASMRPKDPIDYGYVGDIERVNTQALTPLQAAQSTLVIAPITHDGSGTLLNTNADTIAAELALALAPDAELIYAFDHIGVLKDVNDPESLITSIDRGVFGAAWRRQGRSMRECCPSCTTRFARRKGACNAYASPATMRSIRRRARGSRE